MSHPSKRKGTDFEREVVNAAKACGLPSQRAWGSDGRALGLPEDVDLLVAGRAVQAKRRKSVAGYLVPNEHQQAVAIRADRGEALVVIRLADWLDLLARKKEAPSE